MRFHYKKSALISEKEIVKTGKHLQKEIKNLKRQRSSGYETDYASINLPFDKSVSIEVDALRKSKKKLNPKIIVVVGIGGSNLGSQAVHQAIKGSYSNLVDEIQVFFADTVDGPTTNTLIRICERMLASKEEILINVISKSGTTLETIAIFETFIKLLKKHRGENHNRYVVATTVKGSKLDLIAEKEGYSTLYMPKTVGGRYSIFSAVGMFPLAMAKIDIHKMIEGAKKAMKPCLHEDPLKNPAALSAIIQYIKSGEGFNISDHFFFSKDLEGIGKWYRQLMGESIGKQWDKHHENQIFAGITPTVSIGSTDLHSMAQLYLGGPFDKFTNFINIKQKSPDVTLPRMNEFENLVPDIQGKTMSGIMDAVYAGVTKAFKKAGRPYSEIILEDSNEVEIGFFLQYKMIEMIYLGYLFDVNPFDQPNVEQYKIEIKKTLKKIN